MLNIWNMSLNWIKWKKKNMNQSNQYNLNSIFLMGKNIFSFNLTLSLYGRNQHNSEKKKKKSFIFEMDQFLNYISVMWFTWVLKIEVLCFSLQKYFNILWFFSLHLHHRYSAFFGLCEKNKFSFLFKPKIHFWSFEAQML